jgi:hypothetical protein
LSGLQRAQLEAQGWQVSLILMVFSGQVATQAPSANKKGNLHEVQADSLVQLWQLLPQATHSFSLLKNGVGHLSRHLPLSRNVGSIQAVQVSPF